ncbi:MAG: CHAT domain-containing protein [Cyanobacteria bacterium RU_5_0]|nr:CHAT domain-containing protein [Cyanobacteria bacterium RU_5_0]
MKILFLSANPPGTAKLDLDKEVSKIEDGLRRSKLRDQFQLKSEWAVDSNSLRRALLEETPDIVHFSGHGEGQTGLVLVGQDGQPKPATGEALSGLFKQFPSIKCVLLNACYAEAQAEAIVQHIDYVIGMKQSVRDDAAIAFATGFYDGLGYGKSIDIAFELGRNAIQFELASFSGTKRAGKLIPVDLEKVEPLPDHLIPVLLKKKTETTESLTNHTTSSSERNSLSEKLRKDDITKAEALKIYRLRVQEFLADFKLTQIEKFQLAILANVLGLPETDANQILQEEQKKQQYNAQSATNRQSWFTKIDKLKIISGCVAVLIASAGSFLVYKQTTPKYDQLQTLLENEDWKSADDETARIMWTIADRQQERSLRVEDFEKIPCSDLRDIDDLWEKYSKNHFGFDVQKRIWLSSDVNSDLGKFVDRVEWGQRQEDGSFFYWLMDEKSFDLSVPAGKLPWAVTYYGGNDDTRNRYMSRLIQCLP